MGDHADRFRNDWDHWRRQAEKADAEEARGAIPAPAWLRAEPWPSHEDEHRIASANEPQEAQW